MLSPDTTRLQQTCNFSNHEVNRMKRNSVPYRERNRARLLLVSRKYALSRFMRFENVANLDSSPYRRIFIRIIFLTSIREKIT